MKPRLRLLPAAVLVLSTALGSVSGANVEEHGAEFAPSLELDGERLELIGTGTVRYRVVFTVYAAGLYLPANTDERDLLDGGTARSLEIEYFHSIRARDIIRAAETVLDEQLSADERARIASQTEAFHRLYRDVRDGDRYRMDYRPGHGTRLRLNGEVLGSVEGEAFAAAYFGIWLDADAPLSERLRRKLLADLGANG